MYHNPVGQMFQQQAETMKKVDEEKVARDIGRDSENKGDFKEVGKHATGHKALNTRHATVVNAQ